jgi:hypothetical protein
VQARWFDLDIVCSFEAPSECAEADDELLKILDADSSHVAGFGGTRKRKCQQVNDQDAKPCSATWDGGGG